MIAATDIFVKYGDRTLLDHVNLIVGTKDKVGLVGRNGAGKSTMLKILAKEITPDKGDITRPTGTTLGFLHQEMEIPMGKTVIEETMTAFDEAKQMEARIEEINQLFVTRTDYESDSYADLLNEFSDLNERFALIGGGSMEADAIKVLQGLGFKDKDHHRLIEEFSGGWQMRVLLAKMLLQKPDYLLLDEPTNHLDIESIIWLESFLKYYPGAIITISHDKQFLDTVTSRTVEVELGKLYDYKASYTKYVELRAERREKLASAFNNQQKVLAQKERTISRFMAKATKTKMAQSMKKQLDKIERIEMDTEDVATMNIRFAPAPRSGDIAVDARNVTKRYDELLVLDDVDVKLDRGDRIAFVGQNGQGKTTLAKILVDKIKATGGDIKLGHNISIGYYAQNQSDTLHSSSTLIETMEQHSPPEMRTKLRNILGAFMFSGEDVEKKVSVLSGGERARLAMACMLLKPFNLLVLDEPTNHLDMLSKEVLKHALEKYDGTMIVVSHDRDFLAGLTNRTLEFRDKKLYNHLGDVNYFLEKRALDNMRDVEKSAAKAAKKEEKKAAAAAVRKEVSREERKRLNKNISQAEKAIERAEEAIAKIEVEMADADFYKRPDSQEVTNKYAGLKKELEQSMSKWEAAQEEWDRVVGE